MKDDSVMMKQAPDALIDDECPMAIAPKENRVMRGEAVAERPDGMRIWFEPYPMPLRDGEGRMVGGINMLHDVTERKRAEAGLRHHSEQYETLLNQAPLGVYLVDADFRIREVNLVALPVFGDIPELIDRDFDEVIHTLWTKEYADEIVRIFRNTLETGEPYYTQERAEFRVDRGVVEYYEWRLDRITLPDGRHGVVCYFRDISAQVQAREKIRESEERYRELAGENQRLYEQEQRAREAAESATRAKDEFIWLVSHELRSPLISVLSYSQMLRSNPDGTEQVRQTCEIIERNARTQLQLIEDLLDTARIVQGKLWIEKRPTDIIPLLAEALNVARPMAEAKSIELRASYGETPGMVGGDSIRLQQVIGNLLSNAIKFTPEGGRVELWLERSGEELCIVVSDTGVGIDPTVLPYIFDRFSQNDSSSSKRHGGLGLGLALAKHLVELHGGTIEAASEGKGCGSTFTVKLPLAAQNGLLRIEPPALFTEGKIQLSGEGTIEGVSVLAVDDEEDALVLLGKLLSQYGAVVTTVSSGAEALSILDDQPDSQRPDVFICDIIMPKEDGYTVMKRVRRLEAERRVKMSQRMRAIALTSMASRDDWVRALSAGFNMHIAKPVEPTELVMMIASLVGERTKSA